MSPDPSGVTALSELERRATTTGPAFGSGALIVCDRLVRIYRTDDVEVQALQGLDLLVSEGELTAIVGASGSGKSTLLGILAGLDTPTAGNASVAGCDLLTMDARTRLRYRRETVGFIWQRTARNLLPYLTAGQNVALPMRLRGGRGGRAERRRRAARVDELLGMLGMGDKRDRLPAQLSGGEQQRVAIATALANSPAVVFADEPTGELDSRTAEEVFAALRTVNAELGTTILVVTHDHAVSTQVDRTVSISDGLISSETLRRTRTGEDGAESTEAREYTTIDRSGRLRLPPEFTGPLAIRDRVLLELRPDHVEIRPDDHVEGGAQAPQDE